MATAVRMRCLITISSTSAFAATGSPDLNHATLAISMDRRDRELIAGLSRLSNDVDWYEADPWPEHVSDDNISLSQAGVTWLTAMAYMLAHPGDFASGWHGSLMNGATIFSQPGPAPWVGLGGGTDRGRRPAV